VALDEFALQSVPDTHYAWAPKNSAPTVPSDERNRQKLNGFLSVDVQRGTTDVDFRAQGKTADAVAVVVLLVLRYVQRGFRWITVILDNATLHRAAMKAAVAELLAEIAENPAWADLKNVRLEFLHTPPYSPALNPAEYLIHLVRQDALYHLPCTFTLQDKAERVKRRLAQGPPLTPQHMQNLLRHIGNLPISGKPVKKWPKLE
jgi:transposase